MDIYEQLACHLDNLPSCLPALDDGIDLELVRQRFTPEEARLALHLTLTPEEPRAIARRAGIPWEEAERRLEQMVRKGLIFSIHSEGGLPHRSAAQYGIGVWQFHVDDLAPGYGRVPALPI
jgi:electron transport complex protein RnfB